MKSTEGQRPGTEQQPATGDTRGFDPLGLPRDREVVPEVHPRAGQIQGAEQLVVNNPADSDSTAVKIPAKIEQVDTTYGQAFRIQLDC